MKKTMIQNSMPRKWEAEGIDPEPAHEGNVMEIELTDEKALALGTPGV